MKKINMIIYTFGILLATVYTILFCSTDIDSQNAYSFMINCMLIPMCMIFITMFIIGFICLDTKKVSFFSLITSLIYTTSSSIVIYIYINKSVMNNIMSNTHISKGTTIAFNTEITFSNAITSIFVNLIVSFLGGMLGVIIRKAIKKRKARLVNL